MDAINKVGFALVDSLERRLASTDGKRGLRLHQERQICGFIPSNRACGNAAHLLLWQKRDQETCF